jgi:hypothetical protein
MIVPVTYPSERVRTGAQRPCHADAGRLLMMLYAHPDEARLRSDIKAALAGGSASLPTPTPSTSGVRPTTVATSRRPR